MDISIIHAEGGHRTRSEVLASELSLLGNRIHYGIGANSDIVIVDMPKRDADAVLSSIHDGIFIVTMGFSHFRSNLIWHPLGLPGDNVLIGKEYLIVDRILFSMRNAEKKYDLFMFFGTKDIRGCLPKAMEAIPDGWSKVVIDFSGKCSGEGIFGRLYHYEVSTLLSQSKRALVAFGQTAFEALAAGVPTVAVTQTPAHIGEARRLGVKYIDWHVLQPHTSLEDLFTNVPEIDIPDGGAKRTVEAILEYYYKFI